MADISKYFSVGINGVFHILILFSFLSVLFFTIITSIETKTFEEQIQDLSNSSVKEVFKNLSTQDKQRLSRLVNTDVGGGQSPIDIAIERYSKTSDSTLERNMWVKITAVQIISSIFVSLIIVLMVLKFTCDKDIGLFDIIKENTITFIFIGAVEYLFFVNVALKYIPVLPSTLSTSLIKSFKQSFVS